MAFTTLSQMAVHFVKLERFDGGNFLRWQRKVRFLQATLKVVYVLDTPKPVKHDNETVAETRARQKWDNDDYICKGHILNRMSDILFDAYQNVATTKELWEKLEVRYITEDATSKTFLVSRFNNYKMIDGRPIMEQLTESERILNNFKQHNMNIDESIIVSSIIDKLPPSWKDFKRSIKHKRKIMLQKVDGSSHLVEVLSLGGPRNKLV